MAPKKAKKATRAAREAALSTRSMSPAQRQLHDETVAAAASSLSSSKTGRNRKGHYAKSPATTPKKTMRSNAPDPEESVRRLRGTAEKAQRTASTKLRTSTGGFVEVTPRATRSKDIYEPPVSGDEDETGSDAGDESEDPVEPEEEDDDEEDEHGQQPSPGSRVPKRRSGRHSVGEDEEHVEIPARTKPATWTSKELRILGKHKEGDDWGPIERALPNRIPSAIKNRWKRLQEERSKKRSIEADPADQSPPKKAKTGRSRTRNDSGPREDEAEQDHKRPVTTVELNDEHSQQKVDEKDDGDSGSQYELAPEEPSRQLIVPLAASLSVYGHADTVAKVFTAAQKRIDDDTEYIDRKNETDSIKAIYFIKDRICDTYNELEDADDAEDASVLQASISSSLQELASAVEHLEPEGLSRKDKALLVEQMNTLTVIDLVSTLSRALAASARLRYEDPESRLWELQCWVSIIGTAATHYKRTLDSRNWSVEVYNIREIRHKILVPLKNILAPLVLQEKNMVRRERVRLESEQKIQDLAERRKRREMQMDLGQKYDNKHLRLRGLALERARWEADPEQRKQLAFKCREFDEWLSHVHHIDDEEVQEVDADGNPIERVSLFRPRTAFDNIPRWPPVEVGTDWEDEEKWALMEALDAASVNELQGKEVFPRIFADCCRTGQLLSSRTVPEILRAAAEQQSLILAMGSEWLEDEQNVRFASWIERLPDLDLLELV